MHTAEVRIVYGISSDIPRGKLKLKNCIATDTLSNSIVKNILIKLIHVVLYPQQVNYFSSDVNDTKASKCQVCT